MLSGWRGMRMGQRALAEGLVLLALLGWWWSSLELPATVLPSPPAVGHRLIAILTTPELNWHVAVTTLRVLLSVATALSALIGLFFPYLKLTPCGFHGLISRHIKTTPRLLLTD